MKTLADESVVTRCELSGEWDSPIPRPLAWAEVLHPFRVRVKKENMTKRWKYRGSRFAGRANSSAAVCRGQRLSSENHDVARARLGHGGAEFRNKRQKVLETI